MSVAVLHCVKEDRKRQKLKLSLSLKKHIQLVLKNFLPDVLSKYILSRTFDNINFFCLCTYFHISRLYNVSFHANHDLDNIGTLEVKPMALCSAHRNIPGVFGKMAELKLDIEMIKAYNIAFSGAKMAF